MRCKRTSLDLTRKANQDLEKQFICRFLDIIKSLVIECTSGKYNYLLAFFGYSLALASGLTLQLWFGLNCLVSVGFFQFHPALGNTIIHPDL